MKTFKGIVTLFTFFAFMTFLTQPIQAEVTYVTDAGGYAYDEARASTNLAPAIALGTVVIVAIIAVAVQNSHDSSSSHSTFVHGHFISSSSSGS
jgi:hypothetical protein